MLKVAGVAGVMIGESRVKCVLTLTNEKKFVKSVAVVDDGRMVCWNDLDEFIDIWRSTAELIAVL